jgi:6-phosphogluconate dehydrogenase
MSPAKVVPAPGLMVSLGYLDEYRNAWLPANLIQVLRNYFGIFAYEWIDAKGRFTWNGRRSGNHEKE